MEEDVSAVRLFLPCRFCGVFYSPEGGKVTDRQFMRRAITLAKKGQGWCHPNPMVGCVIVRDGRIIGEGYHRRCGELHAERNALASVKGSAEGATLYVTLEPCCHHGRTAPCTDAIIENRIAKVVIGSRDPNPKVSGKGVRLLREAGIEVVTDFMREECDRLNPVFFHYITTGLPYVTMKYAMTLDGKTATKTGASKWISGPSSLKEVHRMRHANMGIMAGIGTVLADNPLLTCRLPGGKNPVRIICDSKLRIPFDSNLVRTADKIRTIVVCSNSYDISKIQSLERAGIEVLILPGKDGRIDLKALMRKLGSMEIDSILLEGGAGLNASAVEAGIVNEIRAFVAPRIFGGRAVSPVEGSGVELPSQAYSFSLKEMKRVGGDVMLSYVREEKCSLE